MPMLRLVRPTSVDARGTRAAQKDPYGFQERLREKSVDELIAAFNRGVGSTAWVSARAAHLVALRDALLATGLDCSGFISADSMVLDRRVERCGKSIVPIP
jgi:hypothetical protein